MSFGDRIIAYRGRDAMDLGMTDASTFEGYHSTSILRAGDDVPAARVWKRDYFIFHYRRYLPTDRGAAIADVGCGFGPYLSTLRELGYTNLSGVDLGAEQVEHARTELGLPVDEGDAVQWLRARPDGFDLILAFDILEHLDVADLVDMARALGGALRPGGRVILQVPNGLAPFNEILHGDVTHKRGFTAKSLRQVCLIGGLEPIAYLELAPYPHGVRSRVQRAVWKALLAPLLRLFVTAAHGRVLAPIFTPNIAAVGERPR